MSKLQMNKKIGIIGLNARATAQSAKRAGFDVFLATYFCDVDTAGITKNFFSMQKEKFKPDLKEYSVYALTDFAIEKLKGKVEDVILTSNIGDSVKCVKKIEENFNIIGNNSENVKKAKDWKNIKRLLDEYSILYPETFIIDCRNIKFKLNFPCVIKAMNIDNGKCPPRIIFSFAELENLINKNKIKGEILIQKFIEGIPLSCSVLSNKDFSISISVNRQLIGEKIFGAYGLKYCGNIVPYEGKKELIKKIMKISEIIISELSLIGSNGIDYVINKEKIYFMEINPRIQDTIENVEKYLNINLVEEHINACNGKITENFKFNNKNFYGKCIIYAKKDVKIKNLKFENIGDVPHEGAFVKKNEPICSIYEEGKSNGDVFKKMKNKAKMIYSLNL